MITKTSQTIDNFLSDIPNQKEVKLLANYFRELAQPPYLKDGDITLLTNTDEPVSLSIIKFNSGIRVSFGFYNIYDGEGNFDAQGSIWAGNVVGNYGKDRGTLEKGRDITFEIPISNYLSNKSYRQIFNLISDFHERASEEFIQ
jgi:hypothetical protein